jgi:phosphopantetheinyl transferase
MENSNIIQCCLCHRIVTDGSPAPAEDIAAGQDLPPGAIDIWSVFYADLAQYYPHLSGLINADEARKAAGFTKSGDSKRYILRRGIVRVILGHYVHEAPEKIRFVQGTCGKPDLELRGTVPGVRFSLSHTDEMVCLGVTRDSEIGMDLVKIIAGSSWSAIGHYLFTPDERAWIARKDGDLQHARFFRIWCLKEALIKAAGSNLRMMNETDVSGIMTDTFLNGYYPVTIGKNDMRFFICESGYRGGHHGTVVIVPNERPGTLKRYSGFLATMDTRDPFKAGTHRDSDNCTDGLLPGCNPAQFLCR